MSGTKPSFNIGKESGTGNRSRTRWEGVVDNDAEELGERSD